MVYSDKEKFNPTEQQFTRGKEDKQSRIVDMTPRDFIDHLMRLLPPDQVGVPYARVYSIIASASSAHPEYGDPITAPNGVHIDAAYFVDITSAIATTCKFGIEYGGQQVPLVYSAALALGQPLAILAPFQLNYGSRMFVNANAFTAKDQCFIAMFGYEL